MLEDPKRTESAMTAQILPNLSVIQVQYGMMGAITFCFSEAWYWKKEFGDEERDVYNVGFVVSID